jgi:hypothetical protein
MQYRSLLSSLSRISGLRQSKHFGAIFALSLSLILTACGGGGKTVTDNPAADPGPDGIAPTLLSVSIKQSKTRNGSADGTAKLGDSITVTFEASEGLMRPEVTIGGFAADVNGKIGDWTAVREMTELDMDGVVEFTINYTDISGVEGVAGTATTDDSAVEYCVEGCVEPEPITLAGTWRLDAAGVGPTAGSREWFALNRSNADDVAARPCLFDDAFVLGADGSFANQMGDTTWVEGWQDTEAGEGACLTPVAPHDGSIAASYVYDEAAATLTLNGQGAHLGLAKVVNGSELASPSEAPESVTYTVLTFDGDFLSVVVVAGDGVYWSYDLVKDQPSALAGTWRLEAAGVGPTAGSREWFALNRSSADDVAARPCLFDDAFVIGADGSFANQMGDTTWVEGWQNADAGEGACLTPVAPHDGSIAASSVYDEAAGTLTLNGKGAHLGLAKVVNGSELASPSDAPESVTYTVSTFDGDFLSVVVVAGDGVYWSYDLVKDADTTDTPDASSSVLEGKWVLDAAGVGPSSGSREWFALNRSTDADVAARPCLFDDSFFIGADGSFANQMGDATWVEAWQGAAADGCATPVAPHDGSIAASSVYDEAAGTLTLNGKGAHLGLAKVVNGSELASPSDAPESVTYTVLIIESDFLSVEVVAGDGVYWSYDFVKQ